MPANSFHKDEKLKSRKSIEQLFKYGRIYTSPPLKAFYTIIDSTNEPDKVATAVPKKLIKHAVDRNKIKRRIREAYRLNKQLLESANKDKHVEIVFLYQANDLFPFSRLQSAMRFILIKLSEKISEGRES